MKSELFERILDLAGLLEDLDVMWEKGFKTIPKDKFKELILLDPTANINKPGRYFKDLIKLHRSKKINETTKVGIREIMEKALEDSNLSNNIAWLFNIYLSGNLKIEDLYKASQYLEKYQEFKREIGKSLISYSSLPELFNDVKLYLGTEKEVAVSEEKQIKKEAKKVFEDDNWLVVVPETHRAACLYGAGTEWCTASKDNPGYFEDYNEEGPLYILIDKKNRDKEGRQVKYQFHFPSHQFMDVNDREMNKIYLFEILTDKMKDFFLDTNFKDFTNYDTENKTMTYVTDWDELSDGFPKNQREFVADTMRGEGFDYSTESSNIEDIFKYFEIDEENTATIENYLDKRYPDWRDKYDSTEEAVRDDDDLADAIISAERRAREISMEDETTRAITDAVEDKFGKIYRNDDGKIQVTVSLENNYRMFFNPSEKLSDYIDSVYEDEGEIFKYEEPYYGFTGDIDDKDFNLELSNTLGELPEPKIGARHPDQLTFDGMESKRILYLAGIINE